MDIFVFDDHEMMRNGIKAFFSDNSQYKIAGDAGSIEKAEKIISDYKSQIDAPAIAIVDVGFTTSAQAQEKVKGFELAKFIKQSGKNIKCIMYSSYNGHAYIRNAMSAEVGAWAYVSKQSESKILIDAVNAVYKGEKFIDPFLSSLLVTTEDVIDLLSKREREVLTYIQQGLSNSQIAANMNITERTVENHLSTIYSKTNASNKTELIEMFGKL